MALTVKNVTADKKVAVPRPFLRVLAAGASATAVGVELDSLTKPQRDTLKNMENAGLIKITETDETLQRGTVADASVGDISEVAKTGQETAADGTVSEVIVIERPCYVKNIDCYFDAVPAATETITVTLTRNGQSILNAAFVINDSSTLPKQDGVALADDEDNTDGATNSSDPDKFTSAGATFTAANVGDLIYLNSGNDNDGVYIINEYIDANNVNLVDLEGTAAAFVTATGQKWDRFLSLQPGDMVAIKGVIANTTNVGQWCARAVFAPR